MLVNKIRTNWVVVLAHSNTDVILSNMCFMCGVTTDEDCYGHFSEQHSCWNKKHEEYHYAYEEFRRPHMGSFGGWHCW